MRTLLLIMTISLLLTSCMSVEERDARAQLSLATMTAQVAQGTATVEAMTAQRTQTAQALDLAIIQGKLAETNVAREIEATRAANEAINATAEALRQETVQANAAGTAQAHQAETATAEAQRQATAQAQAVETQRAWVQTQAAQEAQATGTAVGMAFLIAERTATATYAAGQAGLTATAVVAEQAALERARADAETLRGLGIVRAEATNGLLAGAPYVVGSLVLVLLIWLGWRFGLAESNRRKQQPDGTIIDERGGSLTVLIPSRSVGPAMLNAQSGVVLQPASEAAQVEVDRLDAMVRALRALAESGAMLPVQQAVKMMDQPAQLSAPALIGQVPETADWRAMGSRQNGLLLLGAGESGLVTARQDTPHVLMAGQTGSGKSTGMRSIITQHLLDGRRVTILDKSGRDFGIFGEYATVITFDATEPEAAINSLVAHMKAAWSEVIRRQRSGQARWQGMVDVLVVDELDNWQDISQDTDTSAKRLWQYPRMIAREGRSSGIYLLLASQNPTAASIDISMRRNCTPVAFRLADRAASQIIISSPDAVGLPTGQFIAALASNTRGMGFNPSDDQILTALRGVRNPGRPEWLEGIVDSSLYPVAGSQMPAEETWVEKAQRLYAGGMAVSRVARVLGRNYYDTQAALGLDGEAS